MLAPRPRHTHELIREWGRSDVADLLDQLQETTPIAYHRDPNEIHIAWAREEQGDYDRFTANLYLGHLAATFTVAHAHPQEGFVRASTLTIAQPPFADIFYERDPRFAREQPRRIGHENLPAFLEVADHAIQRIISRP